MKRLIQVIRNYLSLITFSHTVFALPFSIIGFFLGVKHSGGIPDWILFLKVLACMVFARSAAMAFNRYADRHFDILNQRTANREIPSGIIKPENALIFVVLMSVSFIATTYSINWLCFLLSPVALLVILGYSYTKRFTWLCHVILGIGLALAPIGAYLAITGQFHWLPLCFSLAVLFWVSGFDLIYSLQDEGFDRMNDLKSLPVLLGKSGALNLSSALHFFTAVFIIYAGYIGGFGVFYGIGSLIFLALLIYQHTIVKPDDLSRVNLAFGRTNGTASVLFCLFFLIDFYIQR